MEGEPTEPTKITVDRRCRVYDTRSGKSYKPIEGDQEEMADKEPTVTEAGAMDATKIVKVLMQEREQREKEMEQQRKVLMEEQEKEMEQQRRLLMEEREKREREVEQQRKFMQEQPL